MLSRRSLTIFLSLLALLSLPYNLLACACCAEPGTYSISTNKPGKYELGLLREMRFENTAIMYTDARGFEDLKGIVIDKEVEDADRFDVVSTFLAKTWKFTFKTQAGKTGVLTLPIPAQMVSFKVDLRDGEPKMDPTLYKELRFKGTVSGGTGIFKSGIVKPTTYFLVFQGRGNNCDNSSDFTYWRLEITSKNADYAFYGDLDDYRADH